MTQSEFKVIILERMCAGESLRSICRTQGFPAPSTVLLWVSKDREFAEQYAQARELQAEALFDELEDVAREALNAENAVEVQARRLLVDVHKWRLSKIIPNRFGDKGETTIQGPNGGPVQVTKIEIVPGVVSKDKPTA